MRAVAGRENPKAVIRLQHQRDRTVRIVVCVILAAAVLSIFWPVVGYDFVAWDDQRYVTQNHHVLEGLSSEGFVWAWTSFYAANWHPLTWLSHMLDQEIFGTRPGGHHLTSLLLHVLNVLVLFLILEKMTGATLPSAIVAALFGIHPLHVESVAWVAERKDLLSALFFMLTLAAYLRYTRNPGVGRYLPVMGALALGLCAKPMLVTVPFILLLLDYWPLGRLTRQRASFLVTEKIPLLALSAASCVVTLLAQSQGHALVSLGRYPLAVRLANAVVAYATYVWNTFWPTGLAVHYPHPQADLPLWKVTIAFVFLIAVTLVVLRFRRTRPYLLVGWLAYLGMLVPVIGLVQVGRQALADRYTYLPLIGVFIMIAWGLGAVQRNVVPLGVACVAIPALMVVSWVQVGHWENSRTLFERAIAVTADNAVAQNALGLEDFKQGRFDEAIQFYEEALRINPDMAEAYNNLGGALSAQGQVQAGIENYRRATQANPYYAEAYNNLGVALAGQRQLDEAVRSFEEAVKIRPDYGKAHVNLAVALYSLGRYDRARDELERARAGGVEPPAELLRRLTEQH